MFLANENGLVKQRHVALTTAFRDLADGLNENPGNESKTEYPGGAGGKAAHGEGLGGAADEQGGAERVRE